MPDFSALPEDLAEIARKDIEYRRAGLADSVYPCKECQPTLFFRWAGGHLASKHDQVDCEECAEIRRGGKSGRSLAAPSPPPPPEPGVPNPGLPTTTARDQRMDF